MEGSPEVVVANLLTLTLTLTLTIALTLTPLFVGVWTFYSARVTKHHNELLQVVLRRVEPGTGGEGDKYALLVARLSNVQPGKGNGRRGLGVAPSMMADQYSHSDLSRFGYTPCGGCAMTPELGRHDVAAGHGAHDLALTLALALTRAITLSLTLTLILTPDSGRHHVAAGHGANHLACPGLSRLGDLQHLFLAVPSPAGKSVKPCPHLGGYSAPDLGRMCPVDSSLSSRFN